MKPLGEPPYDERYEAQLEAMGEALDEAFNADAGPPRRVGFVMVVFPFNDPDGHCTVLSNGGDRQDVVVALRKIIAEIEHSSDVAGHA